VTLCLDAYPSWALSLHLVVYAAYFPSPDDRFTGLCYRDRATCEVAAMAVDRAFDMALEPATARCVPQPATTVKKRK
jgi:hypothetical protein